MEIALATRNAGKLREVRTILAGAGIEVSPPPDDWEAPEETGEGYRDNALLKARSLVAHTGLPVLADDSGIEVDLLDGRPGPRSARFAGEDADDEENLSLLVETIRPAPDEARTARYRCVAVFVLPDGTVHEAEGTVEGRLITERRGSGGFGYDPIFVPLEDPTRTMAELGPAEKDAISHRGKAFRALVPTLRALAAS